MVAQLGLSFQQARVAQQLRLGRGDSQIAQALRMKRPTLRVYMGRMFKKTGMQDRVQMVALLYITAACVEREGLGLGVGGESGGRHQK